MWIYKLYFLFYFIYLLFSPVTMLRSLPGKLIYEYKILHAFQIFLWLRSRVPLSWELHRRILIPSRWHEDLKSKTYFHTDMRISIRIQSHIVGYFSFSLENISRFRWTECDAYLFTHIERTSSSAINLYILSNPDNLLEIIDSYHIHFTKYHCLIARK